MSVDPETTRIVRSWLDEGVTQLPDRVLDAVLDRVPATRQRRATWWPARRNEPMNTMLKFGLAAAVVVVAALIGINYLGTSNVGGPGIDNSTPTPEATATPEATPTPAHEGLLPEGPHVLSDGEEIDGALMMPITVTVPPDWYGEPGGGFIIKNDNAGAPAGAGMIVFVGDLYVYGDPCDWSATRPDTPATTVDELVAALSAQASRDATEPVDVTVDGYAGKSIILHVPDDAVFGECDGATFGSWGVPGADLSPYRYHQDPGQIDKLWIVDVDGELAVIDIGYYEGTPQSVIDELEAIVESTTFEAP
ncbi:MAG TPA: hypothetical protein VMP86_04155 [Candidatus Binatia bacterium]|nr:hypothetical protein [Candidatus Binatia bacterium]